MTPDKRSVDELRRAVRDHERIYAGKCPRADGQPCKQLHDLTLALARAALRATAKPRRRSAFKRCAHGVTTSLGIQRLCPFCRWDVWRLNRKLFGKDRSWWFGP